jgi:hypothetical protein
MENESELFAVKVKEGYILRQSGKFLFVSEVQHADQLPYQEARQLADLLKGGGVDNVMLTKVDKLNQRNSGTGE